jgi:isoaspartyl peptidase/L-asparaginase-like protein (Ntn-hydrolase superfamily)
VEIFRSPKAAGQPFSLAVHGGAGARQPGLNPAQEQVAHSGLERALLAGKTILEQNGSALDAVCAAVRELEDEPAFNAGRGTALTEAGTAELDAAVMTGDGASGAVAGIRHAKNPINAARAVMEQTKHSLLLAPSETLIKSWGLESVTPDYFVTERRLRELAKAQPLRRNKTRDSWRGRSRLRGSPCGRDFDWRHHQSNGGTGRGFTADWRWHVCER